MIYSRNLTSHEISNTDAQGYSIVDSNPLFAFHNRSCGKVMFSQAAVSLSTVGRGMCGRGAGMVGEHIWQGTCMAGGYAWQGRGACMAEEGICCMRGGHCSGQYASYRNEFLFIHNTCRNFLNR